MLWYITLDESHDMSGSGCSRLVLSLTLSFSTSMLFLIAFPLKLSICNPYLTLSTAAVRGYWVAR